MIAKMNEQRAKLIGRIAGIQEKLKQTFVADRVALQTALDRARLDLTAVEEDLAGETVICDECGCQVPAAGPCPVCAEHVAQAKQLDEGADPCLSCGAPLDVPCGPACANCQRISGVTVSDPCTCVAGGGPCSACVKADDAAELTAKADRLRASPEVAEEEPEELSEEDLERILIGALNPETAEEAHELLCEAGCDMGVAAFPFHEGGLMTRDRGVILKVGLTEFQIRIVRSR